MRPLEKTIEGRFLRLLARERPSAKALKLNGAGHRGWPDRLVLLPCGVAAFIEFKRPGGRRKELQRHTHAVLRKLGYHVETFDDAEEAIQWIVSLE